MEHYCKDCKYSNGDNVCGWTGAVHTTGIECPSFGSKEEEVEMFKVGDKVRVVADEKQLIEHGIPDLTLTGKTGVVIEANAVGGGHENYQVEVGDDDWNYYARDLELVEREQPVPKLKPDCPRAYSHKYDPPIRTFKTGATRDTDQGKLDYVKALSPIVLRRYVEYLNKHRLQPDGSYRDFDNWKKGIPQEAYISGGGRHFMDTWLLTEGYATEDNHGPVELQDALCAQLFNIMGRLHEMLKDKLLYLDNIDRTKPTKGGY